MSPERLLQVEELYHSARERAPKDRAELLAQADLELRREVESLLAQDGEGVLDHPAMEVAAKLLEDWSMLAVGASLSRSWATGVARAGPKKPAARLEV